MPSQIVFLASADKQATIWLPPLWIFLSSLAGHCCCAWINDFLCQLQLSLVKSLLAWQTFLDLSFSFGDLLRCYECGNTGLDYWSALVTLCYQPVKLVLQLCVVTATYYWMWPKISSLHMHKSCHQLGQVRQFPTSLLPPSPYCCIFALFVLCQGQSGVELKRARQLLVSYAHNGPASHKFFLWLSELEGLWKAMHSCSEGLGSLIWFLIMLVKSLIYHIMPPNKLSIKGFLHLLIITFFFLSQCECFQDFLQSIPYCIRHGDYLESMCFPLRPNALQKGSNFPEWLIQCHVLLQFNVAGGQSLLLLPALPGPTSPEWQLEVGGQAELGTAPAAWDRFGGQRCWVRAAHMCVCVCTCACDTPLTTALWAVAHVAYHIRPMLHRLNRFVEMQVTM